MVEPINQRLYRQVETYLEKRKEEMLPDSIINRHIFSFGNGIFNGYANKFVTYEQIESKVDFPTIPHLGISPPPRKTVLKTGGRKIMTKKNLY